MGIFEKRKISQQPIINEKLEVESIQVLEKAVNHKNSKIEYNISLIENNDLSKPNLTITGIKYYQ